MKRLFVMMMIAVSALAQQNGGNGVPGTPVSSGGSSGSGILPTPTTSQTIVQPAGTSLQLNNVLASPLNGVVYVDGVAGGGIGVPSSAWSSATAYPLCTAVSYSGANYLAAAANTNVTPGSNKAVWYPVPNAATPTQLDCAFYLAASQVANHAGADLRIGAGTYSSNIGLVEPTVNRAGDPIVNIHGAGRMATYLQLSASNGDGFPFLYLPDTSTAYAFASFEWQGFTLDANFSAPAVIGVYGAQQFVMKNILAENATDGSDHYIEFGDSASTPNGWTYEADIENVDLSTSHGSGKGALVTTTVSGGVPAFSVTAGGSGYNTYGSDTQALLLGAGNFGRPCSTMGTTTATVSGGVVTAVSSTATGCVAPVYTVIVGLQNINYGYKFSNASDSKLISSITDGGIGAIAGMYLSNITSQMSVYKFHPEATVRGVQNGGSNTFISLQCDTIVAYCFDNEAGAGTTTVVNPIFEWNNSNMTGSSDYYFANVTGTPNYNQPAAFNISGEQCGNAAAQTGYAHFVTSAGVVDAPVGSDSASLPAYVHDNNPMYCNQLQAAQTTSSPSQVGNTISWSNGVVGNGWNFALGSNFINGATQTLTVTQTGALSGAGVGGYTWNFANPTAATSGQNYNSPVVGLIGSYYNGSASQAFGVNSQVVFGSGAGPLATVATTHSGTTPGGGFVYSWDGPLSSTVTTGTAPLTVASTTQVANLQAATAGNLAGAVALPNGVAATTQSAGDNSTKLATDAFVLANTSAPAWSAVTAGSNAATGAFSTAGNWVFSAAGAASTAGVSVSGLPYTGGSATTSFPLLYLNCSGATAVSTFSTAGTYLGANACSGFAGHFLNFFVNGNSTRFRVDYAGDLFAAGTGTISSTLSVPAVLPTTLYKAAGTALPACAAGIQGQMAVVSDATSPTYMGAYSSGGAVTAAVICSYNGSSYSWLTH